MRRRRQLSSRILASVVVILLASTLVGLGLVTVYQRNALVQDYEQRALVIARTFAAMPSIRQSMVRRNPADRQLIQSLASEVWRETGASYIVVIGRNGIRYSHPYPSLIGQRVTEPVVAMDGTSHLRVDNGSLGFSANARVPLCSMEVLICGPQAATAHQVIGEVSAGIVGGYAFGLLRGLPTLVLYFTLALAIGVAGSLVLARRLKRSTFGLELEEIAALVQEREAMLHGVREGVITLDRAGRVTLINDEARRLIPVGSTALGQPLEKLLAAGRLRDVLTGALPGQDKLVVTDEHILMINRTPVSHQGRELGAVITLRDRTELEGLLRELDSVDALTDALRAQQHEFSNRMHTVAGLIELGEHVAAARYALDVSGHSTGVAEEIRDHVERPEIAALLVAKTTVAAERGVELTLTGDSRLPEAGADPAMVLTIAGNLVDNAIDAAAAASPPAWVTVRLVASKTDVVIEVADSGAGLPDELATEIFTDGFTTKTGAGRRHHGIGLAMVHRLVHRAGGTITVDRAGATTFMVRLPVAQRTGTEVTA